MKNKVQLITYADRLGDGTLKSMTETLRKHFEGVYEGVHILPFFTPFDGADAGFDPVDHTKVDPRLGSWDDVAERVVSEDFYTRPHRHIFTEMARLQESGSPIDLITLAESLERQGQLDSVGGFAYLAELSKNTPSAANISAYADIVRERAVVREMISVANEIAEAGFDPQGRTSEDLLDLAESRVFKIAESRANKDEGPKNIADVLDATVARIEQLFQQPHDGVTGVNTGYDDLNKKTAGLQPSDLIIVAARPSMGKTTFAMNLVENAAMLQDKPVLIFSLEMPSEQIMMRSLASLSRVDQTRIRT
ncbi:MAG: DnaB-like helicase C-terminal domain-containing protein, partial [Alloscardovia omnicolens]|nr:DnaB-like helicase C-terminal domain-containing protein [Alloscardovia omnicolens]